MERPLCLLRAVAILSCLTIFSCRRPSHPSRSVLVAVSALSHLLRERNVRSLLLRSGGVQLLGPLMKSPTGACSAAMRTA